MSTSPSLHLTSSQDRDIFDSLESCEKLMTAREVARILSISEKTVYSFSLPQPYTGGGVVKWQVLKSVLW
jgi:hypothetical protein